MTEQDDLNRILPGNSLPPVPADFTGPCLIEVRPLHRSGRARWYCADSQGYTDIPGYAGVYTAEEAAEICNGRSEVYPVDARRVAEIARRSADGLTAAIEGRPQQSAEQAMALVVDVVADLFGGDAAGRVTVETAKRLGGGQ